MITKILLKIGTIDQLLRLSISCSRRTKSTKKVFRRMDQERIIKVNDKPHSKNVLYLAHRDQRVFENYSVTLGYQLSYKLKSKFYMGCYLPFIKINHIQQKFMLEGFEELEKDCKKFNIPFIIFEDLEKFMNTYDVDCVITEFNPLRESKLKLSVAHYECDSHNVVPARLLNKYKKTSKIVKDNLNFHLPKYLKEFSFVEIHKFNERSEVMQVQNDFNYFRSYKFGKEDGFPKLNHWSNDHTMSKNFYRIITEPSLCPFKGGYSNGMAAVEDFFTKRFTIYAAQRNLPDSDALSHLSPWFHSGQISTQKVMLMAYERFNKKDKNLDKFIVEMFGWREMADHFCFHEENYDNFEGALDWAKDTLNNHRSDKRIKLYPLDILERAMTGDILWNSGQKELLLTGKMHGFIRIYWAKRILQWTKSPEEALKLAIYLNDKYSIDGNDPCSYLGIMWSIVGTMDHGFQDRKVCGLVRPKNPFTSERYTNRWNIKKI